MSQQNKDAVQKIFAKNDAAQNMDWAASQVGSGFIAHLPGMPPMDVNGFMAFGNGFYNACPGLRHDLFDMTAEDNRVAVRLRVTGTHTQPFVMPGGEIPATGRVIEIDAFNLFRFENGQVTEQWVSFDMLGVMQTLGVIPS